MIQKNMKRNRYILVLVDNFSEYRLRVSLKKNTVKLTKDSFRKILTFLKTKPSLVGRDAAKKFYNKNFHNFPGSKKSNRHYR